MHMHDVSASDDRSVPPGAWAASAVAPAPLSSPTDLERVIWGLELRYLLTTLLIESGRPTPLDELVERIHAEGFLLPGRPGKVVSDALRWDVRRGRVVRLDRGVHRVGTVPRQTKSRITHRVRDMRQRVAQAARLAA